MRMYSAYGDPPDRVPYGTPEMRAVWGEERRFTAIVAAEVALARAEADVGMIPVDAADAIAMGAARASLDRAKAIEDEIHHDMMAVVKAIAEECGDAGRYVHFGATSNDMLDTATGLQLKDALALLEEKLRRLLGVLLRRARETKALVAAGQDPWADRRPYHLRSSLRDLGCGGQPAPRPPRRAPPRVEVGQLTGAVGTQAALGPKAPEVQARMMALLGLAPVEVSSQVIQRDRYAEYFFFLANVATSLDKMAIEVRSLQRTEIAEVEEAFGAKQVGSSTMPHKRNPIRSEQVSGLARIVRASVEPALQNNTLWDERDLTNSSCERVLFPEASVLCDHILRLMTIVLDGLVLHVDRIRANLHILQDVNMAESVMIALTRRGMDRQEAHEMVRVASMEARAAERPLADVLAARPAVTALVAHERARWPPRPRTLHRNGSAQVERLVERLGPRAL